MVLYSKCAYGSQFLGEENNLRIRSLVAEILSKNPVSFFLGHPVVHMNILVHINVHLRLFINIHTNVHLNVYMNFATLGSILDPQLS